MNITKEFKNLLKELKSKFLKEEPEIIKEKIIHSKKEFVLEADIFSQNVLIEIANRYHPNIKIISEELDNFENIQNDNEKILLLDPLDGTHNFLFGIPIWGFSYTIISPNASEYESYIGLPMFDILLEYKNEKIVLNRFDQKKPSELIDVSLKKGLLSQMMIAFDNQFNKDPQIIKKNFNLLVDSAFTTRISGSAIFDIAMIILGKLDARIWHCTELYDVAPAFAFFNKKGSLLNLNTGKKANLGDKSIIASVNNDIATQLKEIGFINTKN